MDANKMTTKEIRNELIRERNREINEKFSKMFAEGKRPDVIFDELVNAYVLSHSQLRRIIKVRQHKQDHHG